MIPFMNGIDREQRAAIEAQQREMNFQREQQMVSNANQPDEEYIRFREQKEDLMRWQQDLGDELHILINRLRNLIQDVKGNWRPRTDRDGVALPPLMNEVGIEAIEAEIYPLLSRNLINSNFDEHTILYMLKSTSNTIVNLITVNYDRFEIRPDPTHMSHIVRMIKNVIKPAPFRALNDGERRHQRTINKRIEAFNETVQPKQKAGFLEGLGLRG